MRDFAGPTSTINAFALDPEVRAYFSATVARLKEQLWLRVETRWVADGASIHVTLFSRDDGGNAEPLLERDGTITNGLWEEAWPVDVPAERLDAMVGPIYLTFEAAIDGVPTPASSQTLLLHRTRFSS